MKTISFITGTVNNSHAVVTSDKERQTISTSFTSEDYLQNIASIRLSPTEARKYAIQLIAYAEKIDPNGSDV